HLDRRRLVSNRRPVPQRQGRVGIREHRRRTIPAGDRPMKSSLHVRVAVLLVAGTAVVGAQGDSEEVARRQFDSGVTVIPSGRYTEALKDFQTILASFGKSSVADNALLQTALYQLEIARDPGAAQTSVDRLLKEYPDTDSAPMAHIVAGRIALAKGRAPADVDAALASFERVSRLFPNDEAVPAAGVFSRGAPPILSRAPPPPPRVPPAAPCVPPPPP